MKIVLVPVKMFEPGDLVNTPYGPGEVVADSLDEFDKKFDTTHICDEAMPSEEDAEHAERCNYIKVSLDNQKMHTYVQRNFTDRRI